MRKIVLAGLAVAVGAGFAAPASAAAPTSPPDRGCGFSSATDPNPEAPDNTQTGQINGGPIAQSGTITCTIQVGGVGLHSEPDNGAKASATGTNGTTVPNPTLISYTSPPNTNVYLCSQFTDTSNVTWLYDDADGVWENAAGNTTATCGLATSAGTDDPLIQGISEQIDLIVCPVIGLLDPVDVSGVVTVDSDGDINVLDDEFWLCPPYES